MRTFLAALLIVAGASCAAVTALTLDDQPIGGVSQPSRWATVITPDPSYKPLLCAPAPAAVHSACCLCCLSAFSFTMEARFMSAPLLR